MNLRKAARTAHTLLNAHDARRAPIAVERLARQLGVRVTQETLDDAVSGLLIIRGNQAAIVVNAAHHLHRQRFTIAHELGHFLLHRNAGNLFVDSTLTFYRDERSSEGTYEQEVEANAFAAALLMPEDLVHECVQNEHLDLHDPAAVGRLAARFGVSEQALTIRLVRLNPVPAW